MAKASMRPEVKAQKMKDNRNRLPIKCSCGEDATVIHGSFDKRIVDCWGCYTKPPQGKRTQSMLRQLQEIGLI